MSSAPRGVELNAVAVGGDRRGDPADAGVLIALITSPIVSACDRSTIFVVVPLLIWIDPRRTPSPVAPLRSAKRVVRVSAGERSTVPCTRVDSAPKTSARRP